MRIVGGKYRGKKLWAPLGNDVRPTSERAREAIFNILFSRTGGDYSNKSAADIFCGTGAFGFEALSRGFANVTFIDIDTVPVNKNAKLFPNEQDKIHIMKADATALSGKRRQYDLIFTDAPYAQGMSDKTLVRIMQNDWLKQGGYLIAEIRKDEQLKIPEELEYIDERVYGLARILFLQKK